MTEKVFVPVTDDMMEALDGRNTPLVPYHPDRPCWRFDAPVTDRSSGFSTETRHRPRRFVRTKPLAWS